jgi:multiple sugar transport system permease protein
MTGDRERTIQLARGVGLSFFGLIYGLPLVYLVATALKSSPDAVGAPARLFFRPTLDAFRDVLNEDVYHALGNSAMIAFGVTALTLLIGTPAAYWLSTTQRWFMYWLLGTLILLQIVPQTTSVLPLFRVLADVGLSGKVTGVIVADTALLLPFATIVLRPFFQTVPREVAEAAAIDGSSELRVFVSIYLPLARNGLLTVGTLVWVIAWGEFLYAITFLTESSKYPVSGLMAAQITQYGIQWNNLMAISMLVTLPVLIAFMLTQRYLREGLSLGAVK